MARERDTTLSRTAPSMKRLLGVWYGAENAVVVVLAVSLVLLAGVQVFARLVLDTGFAWIEGSATALLLWLAVGGGVIAARQNQHLGIDVLSQRLPLRLRQLARVVVALVAAAVCVLMAYACWDLVQLERDSPSETEALLPGWIRLLALPVGFGLMALHYLAHALGGLRPVGAQPEAST